MYSCRTRVELVSNHVESIVSRGGSIIWLAHALVIASASVIGVVCAEFGYDVGTTPYSYLSGGTLYLWASVDVSYVLVLSCWPWGVTLKAFCFLFDMNLGVTFL